MSFSVNWRGDMIQGSAAEDLRTTRTGNFVSATGITTYFPLPMVFNSLVSVVGIYKVPPAYSNRADLIAKELYQSEDLWWIIYWSNDIIDPFIGPIAGDEIKIIDIIKFKQLFSS